MEKSVKSKDYGSWDWKQVNDNQIIIKRTVPALYPLVDASGDYWAVGLIDNSNNQLELYTPDGKIELPRGKFILNVPPFSIIKMSVTVESSNYYFASKDSLKNFFNKEACAYECSDDISIDDFYNLDRLNKKIKNPISICWQTNKSDIADKIKTLIDTKFKTGINLTQIAEELKISTYNLSRHFKKEFSLSPSQYLTMLKNNTFGMYMLIYGKRKNISEVALEAGFNDISRFNKQFKKMYGALPKDIKQ